MLEDAEGTNDKQHQHQNAGQTLNCKRSFRKRSWCNMRQQTHEHSKRYIRKNWKIPRANISHHLAIVEKEKQ